MFICLASFRRFGWRAKLFVSWAGLRGAVPIVLATFPMVAGVPGAFTVFNIVFFIVLVSSIIQGPDHQLDGRAAWNGLKGRAPHRG